MDRVQKSLCPECATSGVIATGKLFAPTPSSGCSFAIVMASWLSGILDAADPLSSPTSRS